MISARVAIQRSILRTALPSLPGLTTLPQKVCVRSKSTFINNGKFVAPIAQRKVSNQIIFRRSYSSKEYPDHIIVDMPALSPTMESGNVGVWKKSVGDKLEPGDVLVEIETDKAQMDFEYQDYGYLAKILVDSGSKDVPIEKPIAIVVDEESKIAAFADYTASERGSAPVAQPATPEPAPAELSRTEQLEIQSMETGSFQAQNTGDRIIASPLAKTIAKENDISLSGVKGTGPSGRVVKVDVLEQLEKLKAEKSAAVTAAVSEPVVQKKTEVETQAVSQEAALGYNDIELTNMRKVIASRLTESKTTIPHYTLNTEVKVDSMMKIRAALNETSEGKYKLTLNDFIVKAAALALKAVPAVNSSWQGTFIRQYHHADIAIATSTPAGLITPVVRTCDAKGLQTISSEVKELSNRAKANKLLPHEYQGGSFTISNLGMFGISSFTAIINPPHSAILSVGGVQPKMVPDESNEKGFSVVSSMNFTLNADHRVIDGATGAVFLNAFKSYIENPLTMLL
ncbi:hypothetical protein BB558_000730 [Smittium angustum]|uniref:Acetyltransferase component of pyruvate dehydrogenase complex n=1 Tax=Smittium angustum TaxID=133377 RepID=A0A2U1JDA3_SMIAN|nr:hypothetical protein BB558_002113 [Smittium angustum]PWA03092.1 hypothetical protein BB558_000730 [Smittium angustum]